LQLPLLAFSCHSVAKQRNLLLPSPVLNDQRSQPRVQSAKTDTQPQAAIQNHVKPPTQENPRQSREIMWRISSTPADKIESGQKNRHLEGEAAELSHFNAIFCEQVI
jgi:hypothetical protein